MGQIHHVNVVRLVGYCADGYRRALVYEFLPNGPLQNFLSSADNENLFLGWDRLQDIALGIAKGIEYLHQGCEQQILHFDIKPHNVLLDNDLIPKVSDFGLAKLCSKDQSAVSMTAARGPLATLHPKCSLGTSVTCLTSQMSIVMERCCLKWLGEERILKSWRTPPAKSTSLNGSITSWNKGATCGSILGTKGMLKLLGELAIVGLWCIQWHPMDRPSMKTVVQMLEREGDNLTMPPNPFASASSSN
ncbi:hypothetical protein M0R45_015808 [Rubus argutus]|uniref:non-specific serine/threonine protein kinase n=1 Tax=Rubus argutus TaxID=59490 RepID=A0AAW1XRA1_RUBAR